MPVGAIVKSLLFEVADEPVLALVAGDRRCDLRLWRRPWVAPARLAAAMRTKVRAVTGFAIGGVAPLGHLQPVPTAIDASLARFERLFAAAGHPHRVFATTLAELALLTGGIVSDRVTAA